MPDGEGMSQDSFGRGSAMLSHRNLATSDQLASSASIMVPHRAPPAAFCSQQIPHRVQSSTNLDLADCVGSDLLLAMNSLEVTEQARAAGSFGIGGVTAATAAATTAATHANGHLAVGGGDGDGAPPPPPREAFLPLAALAPPPARQPAWLMAQQQQARVQNEHFPSRLYGSRGAGGGGGGNGNGNSSGGERSGDGSRRGDVGLGGMGRGSGDDGSASGTGGASSGNGTNGGGGREYEYPQGRASPRTVPPPGFGMGPMGVGGGGGGGSATPTAIPVEHGGCLSSSQGSWNGGVGGAGGGGAGGGGRRPSSGGRGGAPHLDESWTAALNSPAGAELMEFLTERASRALVLWNVESIGEEELRAACEAHGPLYYLRAEYRRKRVVFLAYFDVRDAVNAHQSLGEELAQQLMSEPGARPPPAVHFSIELHAGFSYKEGSVIAHNLPPQATEAEVGSVFQNYGDLRGVSRHSGPHQTTAFSVEFFSIQDARIAAQELTVRNPWGHSTTIEPAVRSEAERSLGRQLNATLNRWTAEATQMQGVAGHGKEAYGEQNQSYQRGGMYNGAADDRVRSTSSGVFSGRSSDSDSPPPKTTEEHGHDMGYMVDSYTPMTSANTTPATTPGSTPPSGSECYHYRGAGGGGGKSPSMQYMGGPLRQQYSGGSAGPSPPTSRGMHAQQHRVNSCSVGGGGSSSSAVTTSSGPGGGSSSAGAHPLYASASPGCSSGGRGPYMGGGGSGHLSAGPRLPPPHMHGGEMPPSALLGGGGGSGGGGGVGGGGGSKPHPLASPLVGPTPYGSSSPRSNAYFVDVSPGYHGDRDDTCTPPTQMWPGSSSLSPPTARAGGLRGSPPLHGMSGGVLGCHGGGGGAGGVLGYKERTRQASLDEGRLSGGGGGGGGARTMRCNSDGAQMMVPSGPECGGGGGHEFSLDLKKVSKGLDKRTTIMIRNIPNKYTQTMLLQEIDASYRGAYDFFYLPIDFKNKCNVGYAFINFMDYRRIVPFFREFNAQRWKNFNSEKVCAISYARIQGKASMISRFQNSSLMEKDGEYRPLIFHSSGTERGRPEPFPASSKVFRGVVSGPGGAPPAPGAVPGTGKDRERSMSTSSSLA